MGAVGFIGVRMRSIPTSNIGCWPDKLKGRARNGKKIRPSAAAKECRVNRMYSLRMVAIAAMMLGISTCLAGAQGASQTVVPEFIRQAQTVHIPVTAIQRITATPLADLFASDFSLAVDLQPRPFQLSRAWDRTINPKTGQPEDRPSLLIILPLGAPIDRKDVLDRAIQDFSEEPDAGWNISILDDAGNQTAYTRDLKTVIAELKTIQTESPQQIALDDWRVTATLAIASMRDLPGRRVVMALGDIFHQIVIDQGQLLYENFQIRDVANSARNSGATIYAAESSDEIGRLHGLAPVYSLVRPGPEAAGAGPWLLLARDGQIAGWITNSVTDTINEIRQDGMGSYDIDLHLELKQMDGQLHVISLSEHRPDMILNAPPYYIAPNLAQLRQMANVSPALRQALKTPPPVDSSPLELATQLAYFPHRDGKTGTQFATTGFFWNANTSPTAPLEMALRLEQTSSGYILNTTTVSLQWSSTQPLWNAALDVGPGAYMLRVAAADAGGKAVAATDTPFTVESNIDDPVLISSVVLGKSCVFTPAPAGPSSPNSVDYLRAGNCDLQPDASHNYSPQDVVWTLVRITPVGKLADRPSKNWKASFVIIDAKGSKLAEEPVRWLTAEDGSFIATTAFPLDNPKLKLTNGEYAVVFRLKGPGIESDYGEDAPFTVYGETQTTQSAR